MVITEGSHRERKGTLVLVVDDEPTLQRTIEFNLRRDGYEVATAGDGHEALDLARRCCPDLVVLDIMLPGLDGLAVCRTLRAESTVPILLLSARGEEIDRVLGLELGADDYLTKPFAMRELLARVKAMLRRSQMPPHLRPAEPAGATGGAAVVAPAAGTERSAAAGLVVDVPARTATLHGEALDLKPKEFDLLAYFARHPGIVLTRDALLREVWGYDYPVDTRTVDVHIRWLRQKLSQGSGDGRWIETVRGYGYRFVPHTA